MNEAYLVRTETIQNVVENGAVTGFQFNVRNPGYRGCFLSLVNGYYVELDGVEFPQEDITFTINGKGPRSFAELYTCCMETWNFDDEAVITVKKPGGIAPGAHTLVVQPSIIDQYGYAHHDEEWVKNPPKPGTAIGKVRSMGKYEFTL